MMLDLGAITRLAEHRLRCWREIVNDCVESLPSEGGDGPTAAYTGGGLRAQF